MPRGDKRSSELGDVNRALQRMKDRVPPGPERQRIMEIALSRTENGISPRIVVDTIDAMTDRATDVKDGKRKIDRVENVKSDKEVFREMFDRDEAPGWADRTQDFAEVLVDRQRDRRTRRRGDVPPSDRYDAEADDYEAPPGYEESE
jgi:hypothetical protein